GESQQRLEDAQAAVAAAEGRLDNIEDQELPSVRQDLEDAANQAADDLAELEDRLGDFATEETLGPIRDALTAAQQAVDAATDIAESANTAANAASQAALEAAGIAASKG